VNIGFDAKRAFLNKSGLGNYSRTLISSLCKNHQNNKYSLFTPENSKSAFNAFASSQKNIEIITPKKLLDKNLSSRWRSYGITDLLTKNNAEVYHGLSNELPFNISKFKGKKIVTIHDLIFLRYPKLYSYLDRKIYDKKFKAAALLADIVIATSEQTKKDIVEFYAVPENKIKVIYQSCQDNFYKEITASEVSRVKSKLNLPNNYLLHVGTIEERKNLLTNIKALTIIKDIPLVVIGKKKDYFKKIQKIIIENNLGHRIRILEDVPNEFLPALYHGAEIFIYPSLFEGFGIPIIEALTCGTPVITTQGGCFSEVGGKNTIYIEATNHEQLALEINKILSSTNLQKKMSEMGLIHSRNFLPELISSQIMSTYKS